MASREWTVLTYRHLRQAKREHNPLFGGKGEHGWGREWWNWLTVKQDGISIGNGEATLHYSLRQWPRPVDWILRRLYQRWKKRHGQ